MHYVSSWYVKLPWACMHRVWLRNWFCQSVNLIWGSDVFTNLRSSWSCTGEKFLKATSEILAATGSQSGRARLAVGDACTSVAVELGELEGKFSALTEIWGEREKRLQQTIDWEAFKMNSDQVVNVLIIHTSLKLLLK